MQKTIFAIATIVIATHSATVSADETVRADSHAPIGVMGDHTHDKGEWMFSYRFMTMHMQGNLQGSNDIDADTIVTTAANPFFGMPGMPPTLRIVPRDMRMDMHMLGMMYAPSDRITLALMASYLEKSMDHTTYAGAMGTAVLGDFNTATSGWGDTSISGLVRLGGSDGPRWHAIIGVSVPTGAHDETGKILAPTGMTPTIRLPYPMQLSSGSYDPIVGLSFAGHHEQFGWGGQWRSVLRISDNDADYRLGDEHRVTAWLSYLFSDSVSASARIEYYDRDNISRQDPLIMGPVQTADPNRHALQRLDAAIGLNLAAQGGLRGWRLAIEYVSPVNQDVDGPQMKMDEQLVVGLQKAF